jgi:hypothetical protein
MRYSKPIATVLAAVVCTAISAADVGAQSRGGRSGGGHSRGGHGPTVGHAVPRGGGPHTGPSRSYGGRSYYPRVSSRVIVGGPLRSYYYPFYGYGYRYPYYRSSFALGIGLGFGYPFYCYGYPYYGYGYPYYGYGYPAYGYSYGGYYPYGYGYGGYGTVGGYAGSAYGGVRIQGAPRNAQVFVDGYYAGVVDDFDGTFQRLQLEEGAHEIEIRAPGFPPQTYDVNVQPGQTVTIHANVR